MFTRLRTPANSNKATVGKFIGGGTLDSGLYRTKSYKGHWARLVEHRRTATVGAANSRAFCWKSPRRCRVQVLDSSICEGTLQSVFNSAKVGDIVDHFA